MTDFTIKTEELGKRYILGERQGYETFREALQKIYMAPFRLLGKKSQTTNKKDNKEIWALQNINIEIKRGEVVGLIGRNGAGKSTLLKILSRITSPTHGSAVIAGRVGALLEVGTGFHLELTGRENIYLSGAIMGMKRAEIEKNFNDIVEFSEVGPFLDTPLKRYSSGMYIRLAFAVAAHLDLDVLLVDEVLAVGDVAFQKKCLGKMKNISGSGKTVIFVSHNMPAITSLCTRALWIDKGEVRLDASPHKCVSEYLSAMRQKSKQEGQVSLVNHPGRLKKMDNFVRLTNFQLLDEKSQPVESLQCGKEARVRIGFSCKKESTLPRVHFVCVFKNREGQRISYCSSEFVMETEFEVKGDGYAECVVPKLPFYPGAYSIDVGCKVGGGWSDFVYEVCEFEIGDGFFYSQHRLPPEGTGDFLIDYHWSVYEN